MDNDSKHLTEAYNKVTKLDELAFGTSNKSLGWENDGDIADAIEQAAARVAGLANREKLTNFSKKLQQLYFDIGNLAETFSR